MKINADSILYIVITIALLVISGLGSRRKKKLQQMEKTAEPGTENDFIEPEDMYSDPVRQKVMNPFDRLEQILGAQTPRNEYLEGESLETIVDEEELILEQIEKDRLSREPQAREEKTVEEDIKTEVPERNAGPGLFGNVDEIRKAVIYSEILKRKYD